MVVDSEAKTIGEQAVAIGLALRSSLTDRIGEVVGMTEREVMAAGESVNRIVKIASRQLEALRNVLRQGANDSASPMGRAIATQLRRAAGFASDMASRIAEQREIATQTAQSAAGIADAAASVQGLTRRANILALNARIEAARLAESAQGFSVIATDMKNLSQAIAQLNGTIQGLAHTVQTLLPKMVAGVESMSRSSEEFSRSLQDGMADLEAASRGQQEDVAVALATSDTAMNDIMHASHEALSHLQFQDAVAQGLMRLDNRAREGVMALCRLMGLDVETHISPAMHVEIGGDKPVESSNAGEVVLF